MCFTAKLVPVGYGIKKLQIACVVEDDKVRTVLHSLNTVCTDFEELRITHSFVLIRFSLCETRNKTFLFFPCYSVQCRGACFGIGSVELTCIHTNIVRDA